MAASQKPSDLTDIEDQIKAIRDDVVGLGALLKTIASEKVAQAGDAAQGEAEDIMRKARQATEDAAQRAKNAAATLEDHITEKPIQAAFIALIIGFVLGSLGRR